MAKIFDITHPKYKAKITEWKKFRSTYAGGETFINDYLQKFSARETDANFKDRKNITYAPAHAKAAVNEIKNSIYQRMNDIIRKEGPISYQKAIGGKNGGVDFQGNSMNGFIGRVILPELLSISKVGVYIDKPRGIDGMTRRETSAEDFRPYLYFYQAEDIRSWSFDSNFKLQSILLRDHIDKLDTTYNLVEDIIIRYRLLQKIQNEFGDQTGVSVRFFDSKGIQEGMEIILPLQEIPFVIFELSSSLLTDAADIQIAMLQLASSDMNYSLKSNYPFYTEQYSPQADMGAYMRKAQQKGSTEIGSVDGEIFTVGEPIAGTASEAQKAKGSEITVGTTKGRRYPIGVERPGFINPSSEPLEVSMKKQERLKEEIRQLVNLNIATLQPVKASAESKQEDRRGLEAGLSYIGLELEYGERLIAEIWSDYEKNKDEMATIKYPRNYSLKTDAERRIEAQELIEIRQAIPSTTYQKELSKNISDIVIANKVSEDVIQQVHTEIEEAAVIISDHETVRQDHEAGLVSAKTASKIMGYPNGETKLAQKEHAERLAVIKISQTKGIGAVRGIDDEDINNQSAINEKRISQDADLNAEPKKAIRGKGK